MIIRNEGYPIMRSVSRNELFAAAADAILPVHTLLDIGSGIQPHTLGANPLVHICVEPHLEYAERLLREHPDLVVLACTWAQALSILPSRSVDTVLLLDVIEHLEKEEGRRLLDETIRLARCQVVVQTPLGFLAQGEDESKDAWGLNGIDWQVHRSGWLPEDFAGWDILACEDYHQSDAYGRELETPHGAFFAILSKGAGLHPESNEAVAALIAQNRLYVESTSWRVTTPLRRLGDLRHRSSRTLRVD